MESEDKIIRSSCIWRIKTNTCYWQTKVIVAQKFGLIDRINDFEIDLKDKALFLQDNTEIISGRDTIYLGKTKIFPFFYFKSKKQSYVISANQIKSITTNTN